MALTQDVVRRLTIVAEDRGLDQTAQKLQRVTSAHEGLNAVTERSERAQQSMERRLASIQRQYDATFRAQQAMARVERDLAGAQQQGLITAQRRMELLSMAAERHGLATAAINREIAATERLTNVQRIHGAANNNLRTFNGANVAAQFQDIGVTAAMGMSPLQIALQQGTQLSAVLGQSGAAGAAVALRSALVSLVSPISLVTIGLTAAAAFAIQYFVSWADDASDSEEALKKQADLIEQVADRWGNALPALKSYNDELTKQEEIAQAITASQAAASQQYTPIRQNYGDFSAAIADATILANQAGATSDQINLLQDRYRALNAALEESTATGQQARDIQQSLTGLVETTGVTAISEYADQFGTLARQIDAANETSKNFREEAALLSQQFSTLNPLNGFNRTPFQTEEDIMFRRSDLQRQQEENARLGALVPIPTPRPNIEMEPDREAEEAAKAAERAADRWKDALRTQQDRIEAMQLETQLVGESEAVHARLVSQLQAEQQIRRLGIDTQSAEAQQYRDNAAAITEYAIQLDELRQAQEEVNERAEFFGNLTMGVLDDLASGADGAERAIRRLVGALADAVLQAVLLGQGPLASLFGTGPSNGNSVGGLFGDLFGLNKDAGAPFIESAGGFMGALGLSAGGAAPGAGSGALSSYLGGEAGVTRGGIPLTELSAQGLTAKVSSQYAERFAGLFRDLDDAGYKIRSLGEGGYSYRKVAGSNNLSKHALGEAVDINPGQNPWSHNFRTDMPSNIKDIAQRNGLTWGGTWNKPDTMHFQVDKTVQSIEKMQTAVDKVSSGSTMAAGSLGDVGKMGSEATKGLDGFASALNQFPAAPGGGGGGGGGILGKLFGGGGGGGGIGGLLTNFWGDTLSATASASILASAGGLFAHGAAFHHGNVIPFARGGLVDRPTLFPMAEGMGLMGEAGPEAVMPLRRGSDGRLGVSMQGAGGTRVTVNNYVGAKVETQEAKHPDGSTEIIVAIKELIGVELSTPGSPGYKALRKGWGLDPNMRRRS